MESQDIKEEQRLKKKKKGSRVRKQKKEIHRAGDSEQSEPNLEEDHRSRRKPNPKIQSKASRASALLQVVSVFLIIIFVSFSDLHYLTFIIFQESPPISLLFFSVVKSL